MHANHVHGLVILAPIVLVLARLWVLENQK